MRTITMVIALAVLALPAAGQTPRPRPPAITGNPVQDLKNAVTNSAISTATSTVTADDANLNKIGQILSKPFQDVAALINTDIDGAIKLSTQIPALQDGNGQQCWMALKQFGDIVKVHPLPLSGKVVTDFEAARLLAMAANNLCHVQQCTQVFADLANAVTVAAQKIPGAGAVTVPSLETLCSSVPVVVVAAPISPTTPNP